MTAPDLLKSQRTWFAACREAGVDDQARKAIQSRICGKASAADMAIRDFNACLMELKAHHGWKPKATGPKRAGDRVQAGDPQSAKIRALWLALYHLGDVRNPAEAALAAWVKRQTGVDALQFLTVGQAGRMIEIIKKRCARVGFEVASDVRAAKIGLLHAQWRILAQAGAARIAGTTALNAWLRDTAFAAGAGVNDLDLDQLDQAAEALGAWVRQVRKTSAGEPEEKQR